MNNRTYRYFKGDVLYPFGYGLSYTSFSYKDLQVPATFGNGKSIKVSATLSNTGKKDGEEVVQLYVSPTAKDQQLVRSLKGFKRIFLKAGESKTVQFTLSSQDFSSNDVNGRPVLLTGKSTVSIGGGQPETKIKTSSGVIKKDIVIVKRSS